MENINRESILAEIRKEIAEKGYTASETSFCRKKTTIGSKPYSKELMTEYLRWIDQAIDKELIIVKDGHNPLKSFFKKVIFRLIRPVLNPILDNQACVNISMREAVNMIEQYIDETDNEIRVLKKRIDELEKDKTGDQ